MITIFNRIQLCMVYSLKEQGDVRFVLGSNKIRYQVKTVDKYNPKERVKQKKGPFGAPQRNSAHAYVIYVRKHDYNLARKLVTSK